MSQDNNLLRGKMYLNESDYAVNCHFYNDENRVCSLLKGGYYTRATKCDMCPFFKTTAKFEFDLKRAEILCKKRGIPLPYTPMR